MNKRKTNLSTMEKGIFAHRKINSNLKTKKIEKKIEDRAGRFSLSLKKSWTLDKPVSSNANESEGKSNSNNYVSSVDTLRTGDGNGIDFFYKIDNDQAKEVVKVDCLPDVMSTLIERQIKMAEDTNSSKRRELNDRLRNLKHHNTAVS